MADIPEIIILLAGFFYWPLIYVRLRDIIHGYTLTRKKILIGAIFTTVVTIISIFFNFNFYVYQDPYTFLIPLIAITPVIILIVGKSSVRRTNAKIIILAAYVHIFWQVFPKINAIFIVTDLIGIAIILFVIKIQPTIKVKIKKPHFVLPKTNKPKFKKIKIPSIKPKDEKHFIKISQKRRNITLPKLNLRGRLRRKKKDTGKEKTTNEKEKRISLKELWSN